MTEKLTQMQHRVLVAMLNGDGLAAFTGEESRKLGFGVFAGKHGGSVIRAYGNPGWFLRARGLIEPYARNVPGGWFRITDKGRAAIKKAKR